MRNSFPWADSRPPVADSRIPAKNNAEYKGLERHANQYHAAAWYDFAYHHWLLAAWWRHADMKAHNFDDHGHREAIRFCLKQFAYNEALWRWQSADARGAPPAPEDFELESEKVDVLEAKAQRELDAVVPKGGP